MIKVNLITGLLGTGKTTTILHWLKQVPAGEKWAVLVNEFGDIGIDGRLLSDAGVEIKEVPGGCLCCTAGVPFQVGLNELIRRAKPDRILIEPTGLGHPKNILQSLQDSQYQDVLTLETAVCLLNPTHATQAKYLEHQTFVDQLKVADLVLINRSDLASQAAKRAAVALVTAMGKEFIETQYGESSAELLAAEHTGVTVDSHAHHHHDPHAVKVNAELAQDESWRRFTSRGKGMFALGWVVNPNQELNIEALQGWIEGLEVDRAKAVVNTNAGWLQIQLADGAMSTLPTGKASDSRIELICELAEQDKLETAAEQFEAELLAG